LKDNHNNSHNCFVLNWNILFFFFFLFFKANATFFQQSKLKSKELAVTLHGSGL